VRSYAPKTTICDWCDEQVSQPNVKVYARPPGSQFWEGKCKDCKQKRTMTKE